MYSVISYKDVLLVKSKQNLYKVTFSLKLFQSILLASYHVISKSSASVSQIFEFIVYEFKACLLLKNKKKGKTEESCCNG